MKEKDILKNNKLIAEFMGAEFDIENYTFDVLADEYNPMSLNDMLYNKSWDWLMPVVEKICNLNLGEKRQVIFDLCPSDKAAFLQVREQKDNLGYPIVRYYPEEHKNRLYLEHAYCACIEFVKWYNENK